jgi:predicted RNA binding protein YcfA (HicA-like mRNA interferase family)
MPKLPPVSGAEVIKALEKLRFENVRQRQSHIVMKRDGSGCVLPLHRELQIDH